MQGRHGFTAPTRQKSVSSRNYLRRCENSQARSPGRLKNLQYILLRQIPRIICDMMGIHHGFCEFGKVFLLVAHVASFDGIPRSAVNCRTASTEVIAAALVERFAPFSPMAEAIADISPNYGEIVFHHVRHHYRNRHTVGQMVLHGGRITGGRDAPDTTAAYGHRSHAHPEAHRITGVKAMGSLGVGFAGCFSR